MRELWDVYDRNGNVIEGRVSVRGRHDLQDGEYHLVVYVWIVCDDGRIILSRRQKGKTFAGAWEYTGGCAQQGEDSLTAALREVREELGVELDPEKGHFYTRYRRNYPKGARALCDVWVFRQQVDLSDLTLQKEEVSEVRLVGRKELTAMMAAADFYKRYPYLRHLMRQWVDPLQASSSESNTTSL
ncbi:MAG: NUDIX domain-containing protein [Clostridia bacterium]|nr:NUDIX domain-containing protein [Clostridia bacterium]